MNEEHANENIEDPVDDILDLFRKYDIEPATAQGMGTCHALQICIACIVKTVLPEDHRMELIKKLNIVNATFQKGEEFYDHIRRAGDTSHEKSVLPYIAGFSTVVKFLETNK